MQAAISAVEPPATKTGAFVPVSRNSLASSIEGKMKIRFMALGMERGASCGALSGRFGAAAPDYGPSHGGGRASPAECYLPTTASSSSTVMGILRSPSMRLPVSVTRMSSSMRMPPKSR